MTSTRAERRRLQRILSDEYYGPALVGLTRRQQRVVLDLISNAPQEARRQIREDDEARRARGRATRAASAARRARQSTRASDAELRTAAAKMRETAEYTGWDSPIHRFKHAKWIARGRELGVTSEQVSILLGYTVEEVAERGSKDSRSVRRGDLEDSYFFYH